MTEEKTTMALSPFNAVQAPSIIDGDNFDKLVRAVKVMYDDTKHQITTKQAVRVAATAYEEPGMGIMEAINGGLHVIDGKPELSARSLAKKIRMFGHNYKILEHTSKKCKIKGIRGDNGDELVVEYTMDDAKVAGLVKPSSGWVKHPKNMLFAFCIRNLTSWHFPECRGSAYLPGEVLDSSMESMTVDIAPEKSVTKKTKAIEPEIVDADTALAVELENVANVTPPAGEEIIENDLTMELIEKFRMYRAKTFVKFYEENKDDIPEWPTEAQTAFIEKWEHLAKKNKDMGICPLLNTADKPETSSEHEGEVPDFDDEISKGEKVNQFYNILAETINDKKISTSKEKVHKFVSQVAAKKGVDPDDFIASLIDNEKAVDFFEWMAKVTKKGGK